MSQNSYLLIFLGYTREINLLLKICAHIKATLLPCVNEVKIQKDKIKIKKILQKRDKTKMYLQKSIYLEKKRLE